MRFPPFLCFFLLYHAWPMISTLRFAVWLRKKVTGDNAVDKSPRARYNFIDNAMKGTSKRALRCEERPRFLLRGGERAHGEYSPERRTESGSK